MQLLVVFLTIIHLCMVMGHLKFLKNLLFQSSVKKNESRVTQLFGRLLTWWELFLSHDIYMVFVWTDNSYYWVISEYFGFCLWLSNH